MVDAEEGPDPSIAKPHVGVEKLLHGAEGEGDVVEAWGLCGLHRQLCGRGIARGERTEVHEGDAMVLVVVGDEGEMLVLVDDTGARTAQYQSRISVMRLVW